MAKHLHRDLDRLKKRLLALGGMVETAIHEATSALLERRPERAKGVPDGDNEIDLEEVAIEEECLKILALHQPVAGDLRFVVAALKVNNDLERMGDTAANIAERVLELGELGQLSRADLPAELPDMVAKARQMIRDSLESLVKQDAAQARGVLPADDEVDALHRRMFGILCERMRRSPDKVDAGVDLLSISRQVERLADLSTNIAEDMIFMQEGEIVRHREARMRLRSRQV